ncbi:MAG: phosphate transport regulator [Candidatus Xenobia bacterium]|jgi:hypothetical protein
MKLRLFPKDEKFFELFLQQAAAIDKICRQFRDLSQNWSRLEELVAAIHKTEHEGDELRHQTAVRLARTFVTPLDREDIHELSAHMDDILDRVQGAAVRLLMLEVGEPRAEVALLADILVQASELLKQGVEKLPTFTDINELRRSMHQLEHEGDRIYRGAISQLHQNNETVADIVNLIKWTDILDRLENGIDKFEDVFDIIQGIIIKYR